MDIFFKLCLDSFLMSNVMDNNKEIIKTWLAGRVSCTLVIPRDFAREYGLDKPAHVVLEKKPNGILIRKLSDY